MRTFHAPLLCLSIALALAAAPAAQGPPSPNATPLFNGKTLEGWEGDTKMFRVEDGAIVAGTLDNKIARNEFLCTTRTFGNFELRLKVKLVGGDQANAGIQFRTKRIPNNHEVIGYQADMGPEWWGNLYDESRRRKNLAEADPKVLQRVLKPDGWNDYEIHAEGRHIRLSLNGSTTVDYEEPDAAIPQEGRIGLQIHAGPPLEVRFRDIRIKEL